MAVGLVSVNSAGIAAGLGDLTFGRPVLSANGRFAVFASPASNITAINDTNGIDDVFERDLVTGTTQLVSVNLAGTAAGQGQSLDPAVSADGRFVTFASSAQDLVPGTSNGQQFDFQVFVRDTVSGTTKKVSVTASGIEGDASSSSPQISADGRYIAFGSVAVNLGSINFEGDILVRDMVTGTLTLATPKGDEQAFVLSANGRVVAFESGNDQGLAIDTNGLFGVSQFTDIFVTDLDTGTTVLASINAAGTDSGNGPSYDSFDFLAPALTLSADGRYVTFTSMANDLVPGDTHFNADIYVRDLKNQITYLPSPADQNPFPDFGFELAGVASQSADGRFVAFESFASDVVPGDANNTEDVFVKDLVTGTTTLVSVNNDGTGTGNGSSGPAMISANGRFVAFVSNASNLVANDTDGRDDLFVRDLQKGTTTQLSGPFFGDTPGSLQFGTQLRVSADGRVVVFSALDSTLVSNDLNTQADIFFVKTTPLTPNQQVVETAFQDILQRPADPTALAYWSSLLDQGLTQGGLAFRLVHSAEYFANLVRPEYKKLLGRDADSDGLNFWITQMANGLPLERLEASFIATPEFYQKAGGSPQFWIDAIYFNLLGRKADAQGEGFWLQQVHNPADRNQIAFDFANSPERETATIQDDYQRYLGRPAIPSEVDFWVTQSRNGANNVDIVTAFVASDEFVKRATS